MTERLSLLSLLVVVLAGCGPTAQAVVSVPDAGASKLKGQCDPATLPPAGDPCYAGLGCGNEFAVGRSCSKGGGQCPRLDDNFTLAAFCGGEFSDTPASFCTRPCTTSDSCGSGAVCETDPGDPTRKGCVPAACARREAGSGT
jgi:hypothetical protein